MVTFQPIPSDYRFQDLTGQRFFDLYVLGYVGKDKHRTSHWFCRCDCGRYTIATGTHLKKGSHRRCRHHGTGNLKHGESGSVEHSLWRAIIDRCHNKRNKAFKHYGGRGIRICDEWRESFSAFLAAVGRRPSPKHTLERINNDGNYEPGNVKWATMLEQAQNRRNVMRITYKGKTKTLTGWARAKGLTASALEYRLKVRGCSIEEALETPLLPRSANHVFNGPGGRHNRVATVKVERNS